VVAERARLFASTAEAVADFASLCLPGPRRGMTKPVLTPRGPAGRSGGRRPEGIRCGILFGPEAKGLSNDDVALAEPSCRCRSILGSRRSTWHRQCC
jgi:tRNA C32,U32 (ribose-2'-O)-methylase TrmJ